MTSEPEYDKKFVSELESRSDALIKKLQDGQFVEASELISELYPSQNQQVFTHVGNLTRALHDAIVNFHVDVDVPPTDPATSEISDASDRLQYVIKMTQDAANKTMDRVEVAAPIALNLGQEAAALKAEWGRLKQRQLTKEDFGELYERMGEFFEQMKDGTDQLNENLQAIILEQGFQDLTGQVLRKVIGLVTDVEKELVNLVRMAGKVEEVTGLTHTPSPDSEPEATASAEAEGPQIHADARDDVVNNQDEVDDLLSSLGF